jgi:hypothetical protein
MSSISEFQKGDIITRISRSIPLETKYNFETGALIVIPGDDSFIGDKIKLYGVANGCIYFEVLESRFGEDFLIEGEILTLPACDYYNGWDYYIEPATFIEDMIIEGLSNEQIDIKIQEAIKNEYFELVDKLKKQKKTK